MARRSGLDSLAKSLLLGLAKEDPDAEDASFADRAATIDDDDCFPPVKRKPSSARNEERVSDKALIGPSPFLVKALAITLSKAAGTCKQGERSDLTGCVPADGQGGRKEEGDIEEHKPADVSAPTDDIGSSPFAETSAPKSYKETKGTDPVVNAKLVKNSKIKIKLNDERFRKPVERALSHLLSDKFLARQLEGIEVVVKPMGRVHGTMRGRTMYVDEGSFENGGAGFVATVIRHELEHKILTAKGVPTGEQERRVLYAAGMWAALQYSMMAITNPEDAEGFRKAAIQQGVKVKSLFEYRTKAAGTCKQGERSDLTGCVPASGDGGKRPTSSPRQGAVGDRDGEDPDSREREGSGREHAPPPPGEKLTEAPCCLYDPDPTAPNPETGVPDKARVGVPAMEVPPPPAAIPRLPNLTEKERKAESRFADAFLENADAMADEYIEKLQKRELGDGPNVFGTDDAKMLSPDYNPQGVDKETSLAAKGEYNLALHQTANAIAKRAFVKYLDEVDKLPKEKRFVLVTSGGVACHGRGTPIIMFDGSVRPVESVRDGELVMGPDSMPRTVLKTHQGRGMLYRVIPSRGDPFVVNEDHVLSLKMWVHENACENLEEQRKLWSGAGVDFVRNKRSIVWSEETATALCTRTSARTDRQQRIADAWKAENRKAKKAKKHHLETVNITVRDWLAKSEKRRKGSLLYRTGVEFEQSPIPLDPYYLGLWLGDGVDSVPSITTADPEIVEFLEEFVKRYPETQLVVHDKGDSNRAKDYRLSLREDRPYTNHQFGHGPGRSNPVTNALRDLGVYRNKHIPKCYLVNDRGVRLQLLAGLLDTDGSCGGQNFEFTTKRRHLADEVQFLCRSLGFAATIKIRKMANPWSGKMGTYYRIHIGGNDLSEIPTRIARKRATPRPKYRSHGKESRDALRTNFRVEPIGVGDFFGFTLDKDHLYLLGDFTVTHNSGKGFALSKSPETADLSGLAGAVWDAAGEQNATENEWVLKECRARGIPAKFAFIHGDPEDNWENPKKGVVERANGKGRMVDARPYADSYALGAKNFKAFMDKHLDDPDVEFHLFDNSRKKPDGSPDLPVKVDAIPEQALTVDADALYERASRILEERKDQVKSYVYRGGSIGQRVWGKAKRKKEEADGEE